MKDKGNLKKFYRYKNKHIIKLSKELVNKLQKDMYQMNCIEYVFKVMGII